MNLVIKKGGKTIMKKRLMLVLAIVLAFSMVLAACSNNNSGGGSTPAPSTPSGGGSTPAPSTPATSDEVFDFIVNVTLGEPVSPNWKRIFDSLQENSDGRLDVTVYWSGSLIPIPEIPKGLQSGAASFSNIPSPNYPDILPLGCRILNLPFLGLQDPIDSAEIWMQLYDEFPELQQEFANFNIKVLANTTLGLYGLHFTDKKEVRMPEDLKGRKVIPYSTTFLPILEANSAAGSYIPPGQVYEALEKGVVDGYINNWAFQGWFALTDLVEQHVDLGKFGAFHEWSFLGVNMDFYNSLPQDLQQLLVDTFRTNGGYKDMWTDTSNLVANEQKKATEKGDLWTVLSDEEVQVWKDLLLPLHETELADIASQAGPVTYDIYDRAVELIIEKYGKAK